MTTYFSESDLLMPRILRRRSVPVKPRSKSEGARGKCAPSSSPRHQLGAVDPHFVGCLVGIAIQLHGDVNVAASPEWLARKLQVDGVVFPVHIHAQIANVVSEPLHRPNDVDPGVRRPLRAGS